MGDIGARAVALAVKAQQHPTIRELSLGNNNIGDMGARSVALVLGRNSAIRRLSLRDNNIGDDGAKALAQALGDNTELEELDLWGNVLSDSGKQALLSTARCKVFLELDSPLPPRAAASTDEVERCRIRADLFDWLSQVHNSGSTPAVLQSKSDPQDLLFRTFSLVKTYPSNAVVPEAEHRLIGAACMLVAATLNGGVAAEDVAQLSAWLAFVADGAFTDTEVHNAAEQVREVLGFKVHQPTPYTFLRRYLRKTGWTEESFSLANYLLELAFSRAEFGAYRPQAIAAAAAVLSRQYLGQDIVVHHIPCWKATLLRCSHVDLQRELAPCAAAMARLHASEHGRRGRFVNRKYEWARLHMVAKIRPNPAPCAHFFASFLSGCKCS